MSLAFMAVVKSADIAAILSAYPYMAVVDYTAAHNYSFEDNIADKSAYGCSSLISSKTS